MKNAENIFQIDVISSVNFPFIQEEMTLWWIRDEMAIRIGNKAKLGFLTDDHDLETQSWKLDAKKLYIARRKA